MHTKIDEAIKDQRQNRKPKAINIKFTDNIHPNEIQYNLVQLSLTM